MKMSNSCLNNVIIFGPPRTGTKLLRQIYVNRGYHNYGEYFDTWSSRVVENNSERLDSNDILVNYKDWISYPERSSYRHVKETFERYSNFNSKNLAVLTLWWDNLKNCPPLLQSFKNNLWLLTTRNRYDQLRSYCVSILNRNFDGKIQNLAQEIPKSLFVKQYWTMFEIDIMQQWISRNFQSKWVNFDDLINGNADIDNYTVSSQDENYNLDDYILNQDDVCVWFNELENEREHQNI